MANSGEKEDLLHRRRSLLPSVSPPPDPQSTHGGRAGYQVAEVREPPCAAAGPHSVRRRPASSRCRAFVRSTQLDDLLASKFGRVSDRR